MDNIDIISGKWAKALKIYGNNAALTIADGTILKGRYVLCENGSFTPSHDPLNGFAPSNCFPTDNNGQTVNDRDYLRDRNAQDITRSIAANYDARAINNAVIVSPEGVVLSGNGRTMAGILAAHNNTDAAYISHLEHYAANYGLSCEDVHRFSHARLVFELSEDMPLTSSTFARFNAQDMKTQDKTEMAVKLGKIIHGDLFNRICAVISGYDTISEFYADTRTALQVIKELQGSGVINSMQIASLIDKDGISVNGREFLENILIGKAFSIMPDALRMLTSIKILRRNMICSLSEAVLSINLANGYDLQKDLLDAVKLAYEARNAGYKDGENVSIFARQRTMFGDASTVSDYGNKAVMLLADAMNNKKESFLRKVLAVYNKEAKESAAGQISMFAGDQRAKSDILEDVVNLFSEKAAEEQKTALQDALLSKKASSINIVTAPLKAGNFANVDLGKGIIATGTITQKLSGGYYMTFGGCNPVYFAKSRVSGTAEKKINLPVWIREGNAIRHGDLIQVIEEITDTTIVLRWVNGGYFDIDINMAIMSWQAA